MVSTGQAPAYGAAAPDAWRTRDIVVTAVIGVAFGSVLTNQVAAIVVILAFTQFVEPIARLALGAFDVTDGIAKFLPGAAADGLVGLGAVEAELRLALAVVGAVAGEAVVRQQRADVTVELDGRGRGRLGGAEHGHERPGEDQGRERQRGRSEHRDHPAGTGVGGVESGAFYPRRDGGTSPWVRPVSGRISSMAARRLATSSVT